MADTGSLLGISDLSVLCDSATHTGSLSKITTQFTSLSSTKAEQTHQNTKVRKCVRRNVDSKGVVLHLKIADTDLKTVSSTEPYRQDLEGSTAITEKKKKTRTDKAAYLFSAQPQGRCQRSPAEILFSSAAGRQVNRQFINQCNLA